MKKIEAVIKEEALTPLQKSLKQEGINPITVYLVMGRGRQGGIAYRWSEGIESFDLLPGVKIELVVKDSDVEKAVNIITRVCRRGVPGDGKIFIIPVDEVIRVRTGERGDKAVT